MTRHPGSRRQREGGFALLLVFLMAAVIGITLYMEIPRIAFESQRQKEQMLMERGEQYQLAIRRYMQKGLKNGMNTGPPPTWPAKIEDLESTNGRRFLRRRYIDPMTGKDEWRIIHVNGGVLTDSVNNKPQQGNSQSTGLAPGSLAEFAGMGQTTPGAPAAANAASRRRPSDTNTPGGPTTDTSPSGNPPMPPNGPPIQGPQPGMPGQLMPGVGPASPAAGAGASPFPVPPGQPGGFGSAQQRPQGNTGSSNSNNSSSSSFGGATSSFGSPSAPTSPTGQPIYPGQAPPGFFPGNPANSQYPGGGSPYPITPGASGQSPGFPQPGGSVSGQQMNPQQLLQDLLTKPRPGGMPTAAAGGAMGTTSIGGGIAGFASNLDADSIMVCADHTNYKEWEFIFDPTKWRAPANPSVKTIGTPVGNNNSSPGNSPQPGQMGGSTPAFGPGPVPGNGVASNGSPTQPAQGGQNGMAGAPGNFGSVCGMEARPGHQ